MPAPFCLHVCSVFSFFVELTLPRRSHNNFYFRMLSFFINNPSFQISVISCVPVPFGNLLLFHPRVWCELSAVSPAHLFEVSFVHRRFLKSISRTSFFRFKKMSASPQASLPRIFRRTEIFSGLWSGSCDNLAIVLTVMRLVFRQEVSYKQCILLNKNRFWDFFVFYCDSCMLATKSLSSYISVANQIFGAVIKFLTDTKYGFRHSWSTGNFKASRQPSDKQGESGSLAKESYERKVLLVFDKLSLRSLLSLEWHHLTKLLFSWWSPEACRIRWSAIFYQIQHCISMQNYSGLNYCMTYMYIFITKNPWPLRYHIIVSLWCTLMTILQFHYQPTSPTASTVLWRFQFGSRPLYYLRIRLSIALLIALLAFKK